MQFRLGIAELKLSLLFLALLAPSKSVLGCRYTHSVTPGVPIFVAGQFDLTAYDFSTEQFVDNNAGVQLFAAFKMAIDDINNGVIVDHMGQPLLPNHMLSYILLDIKGHPGITSAGTASILGNPEIDTVTIVGTNDPVTTLLTQFVNRVCLLPQISFGNPGATIAPPHPSLLRTFPADVHYVFAHVSFLKAQGWKRVALVTSDDLVGSVWLSLFLMVAKETYPEVEVVGNLKLDLNDNPVAQASRERGMARVREGRPKVFLMVMEKVHQLTLTMKYMREGGFHGQGLGYTWFMSTIEPSSKNLVMDTLRHIPGLEDDDEALREFATGMVFIKPAFRGNFGPMPKPDGTPMDMYSDWFLPRWRANQAVSDSSGWCKEETDGTGQPLWQRQLVPGDDRTNYCVNLTYQEDVYQNVPYAYDAGLAVGYALHELLHNQNKTSFDNREFLDVYTSIQFFGASGLMMFRPDPWDIGRYLGLQFEITNFRGDIEKGFEYVGTWTPTPINATTGQPGWDPLHGYFDCNPLMYPADCVPIRWSTVDNSKPSDQVFCPAGTLQVDSTCVPCDKQGMNTYQDEVAQPLCKACPAFTERRLGTSGDSIAQCVCRTGFFQIDGLEGGAECTACIEGLECPGFNPQTLKNAKPFPLSGYWADPMYPADIKDCVTGCDGGPNFTCAEHFDERMGDNRMCVAVAKGSATISGLMLECPGDYQSTASWVFSVGMVALAFCLFFLVNGVLREYVPIDVFFKNVRLLAIGSSFRLRWNPLLTPLFAFFRLILFDVDIVQPNCVMSWSFLEQFLTQLCLPFIMGGFYFAPYLFNVLVTVSSGGQVKGNEFLHGSLNKAIASTLGIFLTVYPSFSTVVLAALRCEEYSDGNLYLVIDPNMECFTASHKAIFILALCCVPILVGVPFLSAWYLLRGLRLKLLHLEDSLERYGALYQRYKSNLLFWESLFLAKVLMLVFIQVFLPDVPLTQVFLSVSIHVASLAAQFFARPYLNNQVNMLESVMLSMVTLFTICGSMFGDENLEDYYKTSFSIVVLAVMGMGAMSAPVVAVIDILHEIKSAQASKHLHKKLLHLLQNTEVDTDMVCQSLRLQNALNDIKVKGKEIRKSANSFGLSTVRSMFSTKQTQKTAVELLKVEEIHKTVRGRIFWTWAMKNTHTIQDFDRLLAVDELLAPFVSDRSETSVYSRNNTAEFWRGMTHAFPDLPNFIRQCSSKEVEAMRNTFAKLQSLGATELDRSMEGTSAAYYVDFISAVDVASVVYWLCHTEPKQRDMFFELLNKVMKANGKSAWSVEGSSASQTLNAMKSSKQHDDSELRLQQQWMASKRSASMDRMEDQMVTKFPGGSQESEDKPMESGPSGMRTHRPSANKITPLPEDLAETATD